MNSTMRRESIETRPRIARDNLLQIANRIRIEALRGSERGERAC